MSFQYGSPSQPPRGVWQHNGQAQVTLADLKNAMIQIMQQGGLVDKIYITRQDELNIGMTVTPNDVGSILYEKIFINGLSGTLCTLWGYPITFNAPQTYVGTTWAQPAPAPQVPIRVSLNQSNEFYDEKNEDKEVIK